MLQTKRLLSIFTSLIFLFMIIIAGCDTTSESGEQSQVTLQFQTVYSSSATGSASSANLNRQDNDTLTVSGSNGTLVLTDIRFIVEDFELEKADVECPDTVETEEEECEEIETDPFFVDLPLQGDTIDLGTTSIESGLYEELEFEMDDLDLDEEEDEEDRLQKQQLIDVIRQEFPDWPDSVSLVAIGEFISSQDDTTGFKTFAEAEVEIELEFSPPLDVSDGTVNKLIRVKINPEDWFLRNDGTVVDLSQYDFDSTGRIYEFEVEFENGFKSIEIDEDDDDEDDS